MQLALEKIKSIPGRCTLEHELSSSPISIGAASLLLMDEDKSNDLGLNAKFRIKSRAIAGVDWTRMGTGPLPATEKALKKVNH